MKRKAETMLKKLLTFVLVILILLGESACSGNASSDNGDRNKEFTPPSYTARDITEELGIKYAGGIKLNSRNQLVIHDGSDGTNRYITVDGSGNIANEMRCDFKGDGSVFAFDENNNLYILVQDYILEENGYRIKENTRRLVVYGAGGEKLKDVEMGKVVMQNDENIYIGGMSIDSKGNIYLVRNDEPLEIVDKDGKPIESPISGVYGFLDIDENGNIIAGITNSDSAKPFMACVDPDSGKEIWKKKLDAGMDIYTVSYNKAEKCIYALTDKGVDRYDASGNLSGTVLDFMKYNLLKDRTHIGNMCVEPSGSLYLLIYENDTARVNKLEIDDAGIHADNNAAGQKASEEKKVITLATEYSDRWLEIAVSRFQAEHPDVVIDVKDSNVAYFGESDTAEDFSKRRKMFITNINTELMAGKGPDIIYFIDLPYRKYIDKNLFANLGELMENDDGFNKAGLNFNIIDAMKYKGGLYVMPLNYRFTVMFANKEILDKENITIDDRNWTWNDFMEIAEKVTKDTNNDGVTDQYADYTFAGTNSGMFHYLSNYNNFIDIEKKKAGFAVDDFINMLKACKAFNEKGVLYEASEVDEINEMLKRGGIAFYYTSISSYLAVNYIKSDLFPGEVLILRMPAADNAADAGKIEFSSSNMFAINRNTRYRDEAWEFLKLLISKDLQASPELTNGLPVNNEALKEQAESARKYLQMEQKDIDEVNKLIPDVGRYRYEDTQIGSMINAEVNEFFSGNRSAEETAKIIQNKVELYLNE